MRYAAIVALMLILYPSVAEAGRGVRPLRPWIADLIDRVAGTSPTLDYLMQRLACSPLIVHLDDDVPDRASFDGRTRFVAAAGQLRYLRIDIRRETTDRATAGLLAHELQHAVEALDGDVGDAESFRQLFERIGVVQPGGRPGVFETPEAVEVGLRAAREVGTAPPSWFVGRAVERIPTAGAGAACRREHVLQ